MITSSCGTCGDRFHRELDRVGHRCPPNDTGLALGDTVRAGTATGSVIRIDRASVEVYFQASYESRWYTATDLEQVAT